jgi:CPA2 family monovalent cation:H+ antiporter-2
LILLELLRVSLAVIFIFYFLNRIFPEILLLLIAFVIIIILSFVFSGKLKFFYNWIEKRFLLNLNEREEGNTQDHVAELLPWDSHIAEFEVHPESELAGKKLSELELREKFGINIARIERGRMKINVPSRDERLYPYDNIFVIGTDDELEKFRNQYLITATDLNDGDNYNDVTLHQFIVNKNSPLLGKTIHQTGIHENMQGLVIGIERGGDRILNPESTERFQPGDHVWIAGEDNILSKLAKEKNNLKK